MEIKQEPLFRYSFKVRNANIEDLRHIHSACI